MLQMNFWELLCSAFRNIQGRLFFRNMHFIDYVFRIFTNLIHWFRILRMLVRKSP